MPALRDPDLIMPLPEQLPATPIVPVRIIGYCVDGGCSLNSPIAWCTSCKAIAMHFIGGCRTRLSGSNFRNNHLRIMPYLTFAIRQADAQTALEHLPQLSKEVKRRSSRLRITSETSACRSSWLGVLGYVPSSFAYGALDPEPYRHAYIHTYIHTYICVHTHANKFLVSLPF